MKFDIKLALNFSHYIESVICPGNNRIFALVVRNTPYHPFAVYEIGPHSNAKGERECIHGQYLEGRFEALEKLYDRAKKSIGSEWTEDAERRARSAKRWREAAEQDAR